ncbi:MAG: endonuclease domain-containing protein [Chitinophagaceae bacterium]|nr:endonuclease domain-containing protein [Chitinophagaceae bacterium]MBX9782563.1 endonuclease domain-containing protein [Chitinophagaceae bacterium]
MSKRLPIQIEFARELRKNQTVLEKLMWANLRNRKLFGFKFLRQHPMLVKKELNRNVFYIADFYCAEKKLVVEIDGGIHENQKDYDEARDLAMKEYGLEVMRFKNEMVEKNMSWVLEEIRKYLRK